MTFIVADFLNPVLTNLPTHSGRAGVTKSVHGLTIQGLNRHIKRALNAQ